MKMKQAREGERQTERKKDRKKERKKDSEVERQHNIIYSFSQFSRKADEKAASYGCTHKRIGIT